MEEIRINNWNELISLFERFELHKRFLTGWVFRGQSVSEWGLIPSISRIFLNRGITLERSEAIERTIYREFTSKAHNYGINKSKIFESGEEVLWLSIMQHYGVPTRILDWSESPYIALYYSINSDLDKDGSLYYYNSHALGNVVPAIKNPFLKSIEEIRDDKSISTIVLNYHTLRSNGHQGCFSITNNLLLDHEKLLEIHLKEMEEYSSQLFGKIIIPSDLKSVLLARLRRMNIKPDTIYQDAFGFGQTLKDLAVIRTFDS